MKLTSLLQFLLSTSIAIIKWDFLILIYLKNDFFSLWLDNTYMKVNQIIGFLTSKAKIALLKSYKIKITSFNFLKTSSHLDPVTK